MSTIYHTHHIIPRHAGGNNSAENLIRLTIEEHAEEHLKLYEVQGNALDLVAYKALTGQITKKDAIRAAISIGGKRGGKKNRDEKIGMFSPDFKRPSFADFSKERHLDISRRGGSAPCQLKTRKKISESCRQRVPVNKSYVHCIGCRKPTSPSRLTRTHRKCFKKFCS